MSREGLADMIASLTQPNVAARYRDVRGVAFGPSPVSTAHRDRWRARVKRTKDTGRLRFTERGVHLANNLAVPWNARGAANPLLWLVLDVVARYPDPQTALEMLAEHRLWPWAPGDADAPWWFCEECAREGWVTSAPVACVCDRSDDTPPSLADLVAVASHGVATLRGVAELVRELHAVTGGETGATLVWHVMTRGLLAAHQNTVDVGRIGRDDGSLPVTVVEASAIAGSHAELRRDGFLPQDAEVLGFAQWSATLKAAWPALVALADADVRLVDADRTRVVIAVEGLR